MRSVIPDAHVAGNDGFGFISAVRGGNSARPFYRIKFFDKLNPG